MLSICRTTAAAISSGGMRLPFLVRPCVGAPKAIPVTEVCLLSGFSSTQCSFVVRLVPGAASAIARNPETGLATAGFQAFFAQGRQCKTPSVRGQILPVTICRKPSGVPRRALHALARQDAAPSFSTRAHEPDRTAHRRPQPPVVAPQPAALPAEGCSDLPLKSEY